jgi:hypothetical protein
MRALVDGLELAHYVSENLLFRHVMYRVGAEPSVNRSPTAAAIPIKRLTLYFDAAEFAGRNLSSIGLERLIDAFS